MKKFCKRSSVGEVTHNDRRRIPTNDSIKQNIFTLAQALDKVREAWGSPIIVTSWYHPPAINRAVGGASNSQHLYGKAADIKGSSVHTMLNYQLNAKIIKLCIRKGDGSLSTTRKYIRKNQRFY